MNLLLVFLRQNRDIRISVSQIQLLFVITFVVQIKRFNLSFCEIRNSENSTENSKKKGEEDAFVNDYQKINHQLDK